MLTKQEVVLMALSQNKSVSQIEFLLLFGILDPTSNIRKLKKKGFRIQKRLIDSETAALRFSAETGIKIPKQLKELNKKISEFYLER